MSIRVYNTLTRKKEEFTETGSTISIYVCGVTPYAHTHLGHARPSVVWDVIKKFLRYQEYQVFHVQNFTDIDDKIIAKANQEGKTALEVSNYYANDYLESMDALGVERADLYPKVSEHVNEVIEMIEALIANKHAYDVDGNVFFDVLSFPGYGKLSNQRLAELQAGTRFEVDPLKRSPMDFALWKKSKPGEPAWDSPWGQGRPGWHIECSAMSYKYLGAAFDFHGGGSDLIFPHHENEIAQFEGATCEPLARYWLHNGMLNLREEKMSKSQGNFVTIKDVLAKYPKELFRFYILSTHYRSELEYHDTKLEEVNRGWQRINECARKLSARVQGKTAEPVEVSGQEERLVAALEKAEAQFRDSMNDDFNTALAIAAIFDLLRELNGYLDRTDDGPASIYVLSQAYQLLQTLAGDILGILKSDDQNLGLGLTEPLMELLLDLRTQLRTEKQYQLADIMRNRLLVLGIVIEDTPQGSQWKIKDE